MGSLVYTQHYVDGSSKRMRRDKKQGRRPLPHAQVRVPMTIYVTPAEKDRVERRAREVGMSVSMYGGVALALYVMQFSTVENL